MRAHSIVFAGALLLLGACSKTPTTGAPNPAPSAAVGDADGGYMMPGMPMGTSMHDGGMSHPMPDHAMTGHP